MADFCRYGSDEMRVFEDLGKSILSEHIKQLKLKHFASMMQVPYFDLRIGSNNMILGELTKQSESVNDFCQQLRSFRNEDHCKKIQVILIAF